MKLSPLRRYIKIVALFLLISCFERNYYSESIIHLRSDYSYNQKIKILKVININRQRILGFMLITSKILIIGPNKLLESKR